MTESIEVDMDKEKTEIKKQVRDDTYCPWLGTV